MLILLPLAALSYLRSRRNMMEMSLDKKKESNAMSEIKSVFWKRLLGKNDVNEEKDIKTRFSDVLGIDEFKEELTELVDYLKNPEKYTSVGAQLPTEFSIIFQGNLISRGDSPPLTCGLQRKM